MRSKGDGMEKAVERRPVDYGTWRAEAEQLFGKNELDWRFRCPVCSYEYSIRELMKAGGRLGHAGFSCIGRFKKGARSAFEEEGPGPCTYAGGGPIRLNPVLVKRGDEIHQLFEFGAPPATE